MTDAHAETIGQIADRLDNLVAALDLPMPPAFHLGQIKQQLPDVANELKRAVIEMSGENPWAGGPFDPLAE